MFQGQGLSDGLGDTQLPQILCRSWVFPQISGGFHHHLITATGRLLDLLRLGRPGIERKKIRFCVIPTFLLSSEKEELRMTQNDSE